MKKISVSELIRFIGDSVISIYGFQDDFHIYGIASYDNSSSGLIDWVHNKATNPQRQAEKSQSRLLITTNIVEYTESIQIARKTLIHVDDPYYILAIIGNEYFIDKQKPIIHETAIIGGNATIGKNAIIGANVIIDGCTIGDDCIIGDQVIIRRCVTIGNHVTIKSGAVLGEAGFNFIDDRKCGMMRFPQIGRLIIGDWVDIGSHTCIDRGSFSDTIIGKYAKINNLCHIAHNVQIGEKTTIAGHVNVSGSTNIGSNVWIGPNVTFRGHQRVGNGAIIGAGTVVICDIPPDEVWVGNPAKHLKDIQ